jgi:hypothetical protein
VARRLERIFDSLEGLSYLGAASLSDYNYFRGLFADSLERIDRKIRSGRLKPMDLRGFPQELRYPGLSARVGVFIGSFDPFQMTHLTAALRFLASDESEADLLFVVPEGSPDSRKPLKTDYRFRFETLRLQIAGVFEPFVLPLDIGEGADTIEVVNRLIGLHSGAKLRLTHLLGSDVLPMAARLLPEDLASWGEAARRSGAELDFSIHVVQREKRPPSKALLQTVRRLGVPIAVDHEVLGTPSSTAFRTQGAITLVLPTEALFSRLELLFRYGMHRPWTSTRQGTGRGSEPAGPEYEI